MKKFLVTLALAWGILPAIMAFALPALPTYAAYNPIGKACNGAAESAACNSQSTNNVDGKNGIIARVTRIIAAIGAVIAVIAIIVYGFQMITSYGDSGKVTSARNAVVGAIIGLVIIALAQAIVVFFVSNI